MAWAGARTGAAHTRQAMKQGSAERRNAVIVIFGNEYEIRSSLCEGGSVGREVWKGGVSDESQLRRDSLSGLVAFDKWLR